LGHGQTEISRERAIAITRAKAATVFKGPNDLDSYVVTATLHADGWHVDFELPPGVVGGGPHYVIDAQSGAILHARYEQ
jgi:hypothetical protein